MDKPVAPTAAPRAAWQAIKADLEIGLSDIAASRVRPFDTARIVERGRRLSGERKPR